MFFYAILDVLCYAVFCHVMLLLCYVMLCYAVLLCIWLHVMFCLCQITMLLHTPVAVLLKTGSSLCYSKNPHKRTSGLRTLRLKFAQKDTIYIRTHSA